VWKKILMNSVLKKLIDSSDKTKCYVCQCKCTALTFLCCDGNLIQKFTFVLYRQKHGAMYRLILLFRPLEVSNILFFLGYAHTRSQVQSCSWPLLSVSSFRASHLADLWVWYSFWGGLRVRLPCTHVKQIMKIFSGLFCYQRMLESSYREIQQVKE
jgi:hypothetical protein